MKYQAPNKLLLFLAASTITISVAGANNNNESYNNNNNNNNNLPLPTTSLFPSSPTPHNTQQKIDDTQCNIEELEQANDSQLHSILQELVSTDFFQHFAVDLDQTCPLSKKEEEEEEEDEAFECSGPPGGAGGGTDDLLGGLGGGAEEEPHEPACSVQGGDDSFLGGNTGFGSTTTSSSISQQSSSQALYELSQQGFESKDQATAFQWTQQTDLIKKEKKRMASTTSSSSSSSNSRSRKLKRGQYESEENSNNNNNKATRNNKKARAVISDSDSDDTAEDDSDDEDCASMDTNPQQWLPDTFWMDLCSQVKVGKGTKIVNLALNPERNTGYNGTHLWNAIYQENCINMDPTNNNAVLGMNTETELQSQCFEERVLYRLLSGLHTSTTLSIAKHYYMPSKRKGRVNWEPNPQYFMDKFAHHPDYIRNLHFSYVVLLRALKKATPFLYHYEIRTGNIVNDEAASILLKRLLDSSILKSCSSVFGAFDETLMFRAGDSSVELQQSFKGVFHNVSSILDCVQCQQCKLHGKLAMLGYGTALKVLFIKPSALQLERNEIVALVNTVAKLSQSIREVRELTHLYYMQEQQQQQQASTKKPKELDDTAAAAANTNNWDSWDAVDGAVGAIAALQRQQLITPQQETLLLEMAMEQRHPTLLILAKHYFRGANDPQADLIKLRDMLQQRGLLDGSAISALAAQSQNPLDYPDAIVVGSGLAGLAAALNILDRGGYVVVIEKEHLLGGNSNKASSGINACCPNILSNNTETTAATTSGDTVDIFINDTIRSAGAAARPDLIQVLVSNSGSAVEWLQTRVGVDLSLKAQLGGHSSKRTHRPSNGMAGAEIIYGMQKAVRKYEKTGQVKILVDTKVTKLLTEETTLDDSDGKYNSKTVVGVEYESLKEPDTKHKLKAPHVILATGGFASDRRPKQSYLSQYRPELLQFPTTAGPFSTGDGIALATNLGSGVVSMDQVQIHPTGWVDPTDPKNPSKILAAELMRGVGGILLNNKGQRFCNELGTRAYVTDQMLSHNWKYYMTKKWDASAEIPTFSLVLSSSAASNAKKHVDLYSHKGLLKKLQGIKALAQWMGQPVKTVEATLKKYQTDAALGKDQYGKTTFRGQFENDLELETFYAGTVTPVLHYCMGGITIDTDGNVLDTEQHVIPGLHAAGEVTGGVHGNNRLAGNSLLECTVFGSLVGRNLPLQERVIASRATSTSSSASEEGETASSRLSNRVVTMKELGEHNTPEDCWVAIHGVVYDLTSFAEEHPAGPESIRELAGQDGTEAFAAVHNQNILEDFDEDRIGVLKMASA